MVYSILGPSDGTTISDSEIQNAVKSILHQCKELIGNSRREDRNDILADIKKLEDNEDKSTTKMYST